MSQDLTGEKIECALDGAQTFVTACAIERGAGTVLTLRHSNGGFRRLTVGADGAIDTADGSDSVRLEQRSDGRIDAIVGQDRYRLPATL